MESYGQTPRLLGYYGTLCSLPVGWAEIYRDTMIRPKFKIGDQVIYKDTRFAIQVLNDDFIEWVMAYISVARFDVKTEKWTYGFSVGPGGEIWLQDATEDEIVSSEKEFDSLYK